MHMRRPPSSAHIWVHCGSSPAMIARYPQPETEENREGTAAHEYLANTFLGQIIEIGKDRAENGLVFTEEMEEGAAEILTDLLKHREFFKLVKGKPEIQVEQFLHCPSIGPDNGGTPDFFAVDWANRTIYIWDYKFGHRFVPVYPNWQITNYVEAIINYVGVPKSGPGSENWHVRAVIGQPRHYSAETLREAVYPLESHNELLLRLKAATALSEDHKQVGDHCRDCPGRHACKELRESSAIFVEEAGRSSPEDLTLENMGVELRYLRLAEKRIKARRDGIETAMLHQIQSGKQVSGFIAKRKSGRENWKLDPETMEGVGETLGVALRKEAVLTPAQARKKFPQFTAQFDAMSERTYGAEELIEVTEEMLSAIFKNQ